MEKKKKHYNTYAAATKDYQPLKAVALEKSTGSILQCICKVAVHL
jgi:hypothetical protein